MLSDLVRVGNAGAFNQRSPAREWETAWRQLYSCLSLNRSGPHLLLCALCTQTTTSSTICASISHEQTLTVVAAPTAAEDLKLGRPEHSLEQVASWLRDGLTEVASTQSKIDGLRRQGISHGTDEWLSALELSSEEEHAATAQVAMSRANIK